MSAETTMLAILSGRSDANIRFRDLTDLLDALGFTLRIRGSHHIFSRPGIPEILNLQPAGNLAKRYQIRQVRSAILRYGLVDEL